MKIRKALKEDVPFIVQLMADDELGQLREDFKDPLSAQFTDFKVKMRHDAKMVKMAYSDAKFSFDGQGWTFERSLAPIQKKLKLLLP